jgi:hypothetical protein
MTWAVTDGCASKTQIGRGKFQTGQRRRPRHPYWNSVSNRTLPEMTMGDLECETAIMIDRLNELANKAAALAAGIVRLGIDRPSAGGLVNLAWELSYEIADLPRTLRPDEGTKGE